MVVWVWCGYANVLLNSFTGIGAKECQELTERYHIYLTSNGRISMAGKWGVVVCVGLYAYDVVGLNGGNIRYFAVHLDKVVRGD